MPTCGISSPPWSGPASSAAIRTEVDPILEITEFADRVGKRGGPALLFEKPEGLRHAGADQRLRQHGADEICASR